MRWLLLRGLTRERRHWGPFPEILEARLAEAQASTLDLPGIGTEAGRPSPARIDRIVDDIRQRWSRGDEPWGLIGISLGGMVVADWVYRFPADFSRVVMINSSAANLSPPNHRMRLENLPALARSVASRDLETRELGILGLTTTHHGDNRALAREWARYLEEARPRPQVVVAQLVAALRFRAPPKLPIPSLVLTSDGDRFTASSCSRRLAERFGSDFFVHPSAGHDLPLDDPEWVAEKIRAWATRDREKAS